LSFVSFATLLSVIRASTAKNKSAIVEDSCLLNRSLLLSRAQDYAMMLVAEPSPLLSRLKISICSKRFSKSRA
jgi:hypothetical protein